MNLGVKIFVSVGILATAASWYLTFQNSRHYQQLNARERNTALATETRNAAGRIQDKITGWESNLRLSLPYVLSANESVTNESLDRYLTDHREFLSVQVFTVPGEKSSRLTLIGKGFTDESDKRLLGISRTSFENQVLKTTRGWLRKAIVDSKDRSFVITNLFKETNLPIATFAFRSKVSGSELFSWIVVSTWQDALLRETASGIDRQSAILTKTGNVVAAHDKSLAQGASIRNHPAFRLSMSQPDGFGISKPYAKNSEEHVAAFAEVKSLDLLVITEKNMTAVLSASSAIEDGNLLWLAAIFVGCLLVSLRLGTGVEKELSLVSNALERFANAQYDTKIAPRGIIADIVLRLNDLGNVLHTRAMAKKDEERPTGSSLASHLRHTLIPQSDIKRAALTISGYYQPAKECGGVLWGHKSLSESVEFVYMIDDAETGEPAALNMGFFYSNINTWLQDPTHKRELRNDPTLFASFLMELLRNQPTITTALDAQAVIIDTETGRLLYSGTGPVNTFIVSNSPDDDRNFEKMGTQKTRIIALKPGRDSITARGIPLSSQEVKLKRNDRIVLFSRGLIESKNPTGQEWGLGNCVASFQTNSQQTAKEFKTEVLASAFTYYRSTGISDDIGFVAIEYTAQTAANRADTATTKSLNLDLLDFGPTSMHNVQSSVARSNDSVTSTVSVPPPPPPPPPPIPNIDRSNIVDPMIEQAVPLASPEIEVVDLPPPPIPMNTDLNRLDTTGDLDGSHNESTQANTANHNLPRALPIEDTVFSLDLAEDDEPPLHLPEINDQHASDSLVTDALPGNDGINLEGDYSPVGNEFQGDDITLADMDPSQIEHPFTERPSQKRQYNEQGGEFTEAEKASIIEEIAAEKELEENSKPKIKGRYKIKLPSAG